MLMFWLFAGLLCVVTVVALAGARPRNAANASHGAGALEIYKDQLAEVERELAAGSIAAAEADAQRVEVSRRLLNVARESGVETSSVQRFPPWAVLVVPMLAALIYWQVGSVGQPDVPRAERLAAAETNSDWPALIARVEQQLEKNPADVQGWQLLVPNYISMGRYADAANAMGRIAALSGPTPSLYADMGEALLYANNGLMTAQAMAVTREALKLDPQNVKAQYYQALGVMQEGKVDEARKLFVKLLAGAPADAKWRPSVEAQLEKLSPSAAAPVINNEQIEAAQELTPEDRMAMIRSMVEGLDEKLKANPDDVAGWLRLIRARSVLKETDMAVAALATARNTFAANPDNLKLIDTLAQELNLK